MVDTIDVTEAQYFIPEIWANTVIPILRQNIVVAPRVYRDTDVAAFTRGDVLHIPYPGTLTASPKSAGTVYTLAKPSGEAEVQVSLSNYEAVSFIVEDIVRAQANQDLVGIYSQAAAIALAEKIETDLLTEIQGGLDAAETVSSYATDITASILRTAWKTMTDNKCPQDGRNLVISTKDHIKLLADSDLTNYFAFSAPRAASAAALGTLYGFDTFASQFITTSSATPAQTKNIAFRTDGAILAMRGLPEPPPNTGAVAANVRDPLSGLVLRVVMAYDAAYGGVRVTIEMLYGVKVLQKEKCLLIKS